MPNNPYSSIIDGLRERQRRIGSRPARERARDLRRLLGVINANIDDICTAVREDLGKARTETIITEIYPVVSELKYALRNLGKWTADKRVRLPMSMAGAKAVVRREPKGVVLVISPWNYPFNLAMVPLVSAVAAGNCGILKPSEYSPRTSALLARMIDEAFPEGDFTVVQGGPETTQTLMENRFNHVFFTGSTRVGAIVMEAAARHLTSVTLELGGKSPAIIDASADIVQAADSIAWGKFINAGQTCVAPDYVLLPRGSKDAFVRALTAKLDKSYGKDRAGKPEDCCGIISDRHLDRLIRLVDEAKAAGATIECGGEWDSGARYLAPSVLSNVPGDSGLMREEIFGPILPVIEYGSTDEAVSMANSMGEPLALYVFARDRSFIDRVLSGTRSGDAMVNGCVVHVGCPELPFGGAGMSGLGKSHGYAGFMEFTHERTVMELGKRNIPGLFHPPYKGFTERLAEMAIKWL